MSLTIAQHLLVSTMVAVVASLSFPTSADTRRFTRARTRPTKHLISAIDGPTFGQKFTPNVIYHLVPPIISANRATKTGNGLMTIDLDFTGQMGCFSFFTWFRQHFTTILIIISTRNTLLQAPHGLLLPPFPFFLHIVLCPMVLELLGQILYILRRVSQLWFPFFWLQRIRRVLSFMTGVRIWLRYGFSFSGVSFISWDTGSSSLLSSFGIFSFWRYLFFISLLNFLCWSFSVCTTIIPIFWLNA